MEPIIKNTWAEGLNPKYRALEKDAAQAFVPITMAEMMGKIDSPFPEESFFAQIIKKRIDVLNLPIKFSGLAYLAVMLFCRNPGAAVVLLVDCLNAFEGQEVTVSKLAQIYPWGFYDEETLERYIDEYMKPRKVKWAQIY